MNETGKSYEYPNKVRKIKGIDNAAVARYLALMRECFAMSVKNKEKPA